MKTLKLVGLQRFISPWCKYQVIQKGNVITVDDDRADKLLEGKENSPTKGEYAHWELVPNGTRPDYHFATGDTITTITTVAETEKTSDDEAAKSEGDTVALVATADKANPIPAPEVPAPVVAKAASKSQRVARKPATK